MAHAGVRGDMPARLASSGVGVTVSSRARIVACPTDGAHLSLLTPNAPLRARDDPGAPLPGPYGLLLASVLASVAVQGTFSPSGFAQVLISVLLGLNLLLAVRVAMVDERLMGVAVFIAVTGVVVNVLRSTTGFIGAGEARVMNAVVVLFGPPAIALGVIRSLRATRMVRLEAVTGVLSLYVMLGLLFAFAFGAIDRLGGEPFFADGTPATVAKCLYFSFTTLTTVGYGDLAARSDLGHTLCVFEMLIGQIYLVTVVSLIVSNLGRRDPPQRG
jgi:hypothetical protein